MRTKKIAEIISLFLAAVLCFTGCSSKENKINESLLVGSWTTSQSRVTLFTLNSDHTVTVKYNGGGPVRWTLIDDVKDLSGETVYWKLLDDGSLKIYLESDPDKCKICDTGMVNLGKIVAPHNGDNWTLLKK